MSYLKNKNNRLKKKYSNILFNDFGIVVRDSPSQVIAVCNGGLSNGITHEMIHDVFVGFKNFADVTTVPGKSYSFVRYGDVVSAERAYEDTNGRRLWPKINGPVYLAYVDDFSPGLVEQSRTFEKPPELILIEDFVTEEEEAEILKAVDVSNATDNNNSSGHSSELKHRRVKHFGYEFKYTTNNVDLSCPIERIPKELDFLWVRLREHSQRHGYPIQDFVPDQLTINCYEPGQGIPPHVDTHSAFEDGILSLSLESSVVMDFKNPDGLSYCVRLPRRSLCIMWGESRYDWTHGITPRKTDLVPNETGALTVVTRGRRTSLTFRKTRTGGCCCKYPRLCDSAIDKLRSCQNLISNLSDVTLKEDAANELEGNFVHGVYDKIADHFSDTRHTPWPNVVKFVRSFGPGSVLVDVGCGNGKYLSRESLSAGRYEVGCDSASGLMRVCRDRGFECFSCNCLHIPLRDNVADGCICIAVIHHLTTEERRRRAVLEMVRILRRKGRALIYVWAKNQEMEGKKSSYLKQGYTNNSGNSSEPGDGGGSGKGVKVEVVSLNRSQQELVLPVHNNRTAFSHNDILVPWKLRGGRGGRKESEDGEGRPEPDVYLRFYHVYENDELRDFCAGLDGVNVLDYYYDQGNWCIVLEKD